MMKGATPMPAPPRPTAERIADARTLLTNEIDCWVASATADGDAYLIPLSYYWDGTRIALATPSDSRTARDLQRAGRARVALAPTRDVVMIDASVEVFGPGEVDPASADAFAARHNWEPRNEPRPYSYLILTPQRIQSWRESNELAGRTIMRDGQWLA
jgi:hypothetical protein